MTSFDRVIPVVKTHLPPDLASPAAKQVDGSSLLFNELAGDLILLYGLELESEYRILEKNDLPEGMSKNQLDRIARENLWSKLEPRINIHKTRLGGVGLSCGNALEASLITLPQIWTVLSEVLSKDMVFIVPAKDLFMCASAKDDTAVGQFKKAISDVAGMYSSEPSMLLSKNMYRMNEGNISVVS